MTSASSEHAPLALGGEQVLLLLVDPSCPRLPRLVCDLAWVAGDAPAEVVGPATVARLPLEAVLGLRPDPALRLAAPRHAVIATLQQLSVRAVLAAARLGARTFHIVDPAVATLTTDLRGALRVAALRSVARRAGAARTLVRAAARAGLQLDPPWPEVDAARAFVRAAGRGRPAPATPRRVVHVIASLATGGAERQLALVAAEQARRGLGVEVITLAPLEGRDAACLPPLRAAGVRAAALAPRSRYRAVPELAPDLERALAGHPAADRARALAAALVLDPPDVVHGWLDEPGLVAGLAALAAGVPRVVLGGRSVHPRNFPAFHQPWFRATYRALAASPAVVLVNNTRHGAADYAQWLGLLEDRWHIVPNVVDADRLRPPEDRRARRAALGVAPDAFVVAGVFRVSAEKRPIDFVHVLKRAAADLPGLVGWLVGDGPELDATRDHARAHGVPLVCHGRLDDPWAVAGLADASLLTSGHEGLPNVVVESQACGVPPVLTDAGGAREAVDPGRTGLVLPVGDVEGLAAALVELARDPARRRALAAAGPPFVAGRFAAAAAVEALARVYAGPGA